jgi:hypothetical protein
MTTSIFKQAHPQPCPQRLRDHVHSFLRTYRIKTRQAVRLNTVTYTSITSTLRRQFLGIARPNSVSQTCFARGSLLTSKNIIADANTQCPDDGYPKLKFISQS